MRQSTLMKVAFLTKKHSFYNRKNMNKFLQFLKSNFLFKVSQILEILLFWDFEIKRLVIYIYANLGLN
jgi:hypothetical protein